MARRNMGSSSASTSYSSNFSSVRGRNFASQIWENEIPSKFQTDIRQVASEQPIVPDRRDARYRSNEHRRNFSWNNLDSLQVDTDASNAYHRSSGRQTQDNQVKGERWNGNFVLDCGSRAPRAWLSREQYSRAAVETRGFVSKNRGVSDPIGDRWPKGRFPNGRDKDGFSGSAYSQKYVSAPGSSSSPRDGTLNMSYQRNTSEKSNVGEVRSWKKEERRFVAPQETKSSAVYQSSDLQQDNWRNSQDTARAVGYEQVGIALTSRNCDQREGFFLPAATTSSEEFPSSTSSTEHKYVLPTYRKSMIKLTLEEASLPRINGTCQDMCPAAEREMRQRLKDLAVFERLNGDQSKTSRELAVKKFCRTFNSKDLKQQDVRPFSVLSKTVDYLLKFLNRSDYPFQVVYDFLFDRTRAIRQELGMQRIITKQAVAIYENLVRFHILSEHVLRGRSSFDSNLNLEQLSKSLITLLDLYSVNTEDCKNGEFPHEAEFHSYFVLLNMGNHSGIQVEKLSHWFCDIKPTLLKTSEMKFARDVLRYYQLGNFRKFFKLVEEGTFLQACLMELYFDQVRVAALSAINQSGYKLHPYPIQELAELFLLEEDDLEDLCKMEGFLVKRDDSGSLLLQLKQADLAPLKKGKFLYHCSTIDKKCASSFLEEVLGRKI